MAEHKIELTGWKAVVVIVVLTGVVGLRLATFSDKKNESALMREIELRLTTDYFPDDVDQLKAVLATGDRDEIERVAKSITSTRLNVESVQVSSPLFNFSSSKNVVIKVKYSLNDASGTRKKGTNYYLFEHGSLFNSWRYKRRSGEISYYLNFL